MSKIFLFVACESLKVGGGWSSSRRRLQQHLPMYVGSLETQTMESTAKSYIRGSENVPELPHVLCVRVFQPNKLLVCVRHPQHRSLIYIWIHMLETENLKGSSIHDRTHEVAKHESALHAASILDYPLH